MIETLVWLVVKLIVLGCILGLLIYLVNIAPMPEPYKGWLRFVVIAVCVVIIIVFLLGLLGMGPPLSLRMR